VLCIKLKRKLEMFRVFNKKIIVGNYEQLVLPARNLLNSSGTKLNSASRINRCVTKPVCLNNASGGFRTASELQRKLFHVTATRQALPPVFLIILRPLSKVAAILFGRTFRKWWRALPPDRKQDLILRLKNNKVALLGELLFPTPLNSQYPSTVRQAFILGTPSQYSDQDIGPFNLHT
jgi:hypothetical protein